MSAMTNPPLPLVHADTKMYVLCVVHTGPENRKRNKTICDFPSRKKLKYGRPHSRNPPCPQMSANLLTPPPPPECGRLLWTAPKTLPMPFRNYFIPASNFYNCSRRNSKKGNYNLSKVKKNLLKDQLKYVEPNCGTNFLLDYWIIPIKDKARSPKKSK